MAFYFFIRANILFCVSTSPSSYLSATPSVPDSIADTHKHTAGDSLEAANFMCLAAEQLVSSFQMLCTDASGREIVCGDGDGS